MGGTAHRGVPRFCDHFTSLNIIRHNAIINEYSGSSVSQWVENSIPMGGLWVDIFPSGPPAAGASPLDPGHPLAVASSLSFRKVLKSLPPSAAGALHSLTDAKLL